MSAFDEYFHEDVDEHFDEDFDEEAWWRTEAPRIVREELPGATEDAVREIVVALRNRFAVDLRLTPPWRDDLWFRGSLRDDRVLLRSRDVGR